MPSRGLIRSIVEAHRVGEAPRGAEWAPGLPLTLRPDQVLAAGSAAVVALAAFESLGLDRIRPDVALVGAERVALQEGFESAEHLMALQHVAHRLGVGFARPGDGRCERVHLERLAAPGRLALFAGRRAALAGATGMLVLRAGSIETAAALAGHAHECAWPGVLGIDLVGAPGARVDGHDVSLTMAVRLGPEGAAGRLLEFGGEGVAALTMSARIEIAARTAAVGSSAGVFPSDERTRAWLAARGREADWKPLSALIGVGERCPIELSAIEPLVAPIERPESARPVRESRGETIAVVLIGPGATAEELFRLAASLAGRRVHPEVTLMVVPGTRSLRDAVTRDGTLAALEAAGIDVRDGGAAQVAGAAGLTCGAELLDLPPGRVRWQRAGLATCAAAALTGRIEDPRDLDMSWPEEPGPGGRAVEDGWWNRPGESAPENEGVALRRPFPLGPPFSGALRGEVLARLGDQVSILDLIPWGPRVRPLIGDITALAEHMLAGMDSTFVGRARARGGGIVVAGENLGCGTSWDSAALVAQALGVRAMLARSIAPDYAHALALSGVLPLVFTRARDFGSVESGDELEIPGLPEALTPGRPLTVRNLTRATTCTVRHPLEARELHHLSRGGLLAALRGAA